MTGQVNASDDFTSGKNGQISGSLTLEPPESDLDCPNGQRRVLVSVSYSGVSVSAPDAGSESIPGTFSETFFDL